MTLTEQELGNLRDPDLPQGGELTRPQLLLSWGIYMSPDSYENRSWKGWPRHMVCVSLAMLFLLRLRLRYKKTPTLTLPQVKRLLAVCHDRQRLDKQDALAILRYYTRRNYVAYRAHRKRTLRRVP